MLTAIAINNNNIRIHTIETTNMDIPIDSHNKRRVIIFVRKGIVLFSL